MCPDEDSPAPLPHGVIFAVHLCTVTAGVDAGVVVDTVDCSKKSVAVETTRQQTRPCTTSVASWPGS